MMKPIETGIQFSLSARIKAQKSSWNVLDDMKCRQKHELCYALYKKKYKIHFRSLNVDLAEIVCRNTS